jgi:hypothetical protein
MTTRDGDMTLAANEQGRTSGAAARPRIVARGDVMMPPPLVRRAMPALLPWNHDRGAALIAARRRAAFADSA